MQNRLGNFLWGAFFLLAGLFIGLKAFDIVDLDYILKGWWTLFIIVPALGSMIQNGIKTGNLIALTIGTLLFLASRDIVSGATISKLIVPIVFVGIGISMMFRENFNEKIKNIRNLNKDGKVEYSAIFGGQEIVANNEKFIGANINAIFGGIDVNLKNAVIDEDVVINVTSIFGGVDIVVPNDVIVKVSSTPIFGGVSNKAMNSKDTNSHTIYVNCVCMFGGVEIK